MTLAIKERAAALGFDACGVAAVDATEPDAHFEDWLARGFHADMAWMARPDAVAARLDVRTKLPGAQSVVVVARNYYAPRPQPESGTGRVARYAWGRDYHKVLRRPLVELARSIEAAFSGAQTYCSLDTGPVLERTWAARAGVGWIGKNGLLIRRGIGSWSFLGVIVTTAKLACDLPQPDGCGDCVRCIEACPAGAIVEPRVVDSRKCISYHTIENRGEVPDAMAARMGDRVFGCDACQEVCPWNTQAAVTSETAFHPRPGNANPSLEWVLSLTEDEFNRRFAGSPVRRARCDGLKRNARIAQRNSAAD